LSPRQRRATDPSVNSHPSATTPVPDTPLGSRCRTSSKVRGLTTCCTPVVSTRSCSDQRTHPRSGYSPATFRTRPIPSGGGAIVVPVKRSYWRFFEWPALVPGCSADC
jgi:hypothetical protein